MLIAQRLASENPVVKKSTTVGEEPPRSMVDGEVVKYARSPLDHAAPVPPTALAQFASLQRPFAPPTQYRLSANDGEDTIATQTVTAPSKALKADTSPTMTFFLFCELCIFASPCFGCACFSAAVPHGGEIHEMARPGVELEMDDRIRLVPVPVRLPVDVDTALSPEPGEVVRVCRYRSHQTVLYHRFSRRWGKSLEDPVSERDSALATASSGG